MKSPTWSIDSVRTTVSIKKTCIDGCPESGLTGKIETCLAKQIIPVPNEVYLRTLPLRASGVNNFFHLSERSFITYFVTSERCSFCWACQLLRSSFLDLH